MAAVDPNALWADHSKVLLESELKVQERAQEAAELQRLVAVAQQAGATARARSKALKARHDKRRLKKEQERKEAEQKYIRERSTIHHGN